MYCGTPTFGKGGFGTPVFKILVRALKSLVGYALSVVLKGYLAGFLPNLVETILIWSSLMIVQMVTVNVLKFRTLFSVFSQMKCCFSRLEFTNFLSK